MSTASSDLPNVDGPGSAGPDALAARALELARSGVTPAAVEELLAAAGRRRDSLEAARNEMASRVAANVSDFEATAALQLLNRALAQAPIHDPLDWKVRWGQRFRRP